MTIMSHEYIMKPNRLHKTLWRNAYEYSHLYVIFSSKENCIFIKFLIVLGSQSFKG